MGCIRNHPLGQSAYRSEELFAEVGQRIFDLRQLYRRFTEKRQNRDEFVRVGLQYKRMIQIMGVQPVIAAIRT